ncbi:MAG: c-type cytochrome domain-containing protein [Verrucomicrobiota bacterium]
MRSFLIIACGIVAIFPVESLRGASSPSASSSADAEKGLDYHEDIAPLLRQYCVGCHNDDDYKGDYSVERYIDLVSDDLGETMVDPGDVDASYLMRLLTGDADDLMPPEDEPQLSAKEIALFRAWIASGGKGPAEDDSILSTLKVREMAPAPGTRPITALEMSGDGTLAAVGRYGEVALASVDRDGRMEDLRVLGAPGGKVNAVHFVKGARDRVVTAGGIAGLKGVATIWNVATGERLGEFGEGLHRDVLYDAETDPDGGLLATVGYDGKLVLWEVVTGRRKRTIEGHNGAIFDVAFSPDGRVVATASADETIKLWEVETGRRLDTLNQPQGEVYAVLFSADGKYLFGAGADRRIRMWRFVSAEQPGINPVRHSRFAHEGDVTALELSEDGKWLMSASVDGVVKLWALPALVEARAWAGQSDDVTSLARGRAGLFYAARMDGGTTRFETAGVKAPAATEDLPQGDSGLAIGALREPGDILLLSEEEAGDAVTFPARISGVIGEEGEGDEFLFSAKAGEPWVLEVKGERMESALDSKIEVLSEDGEPVERVRLQAVRDSWFEFRGKDSRQVNDFRIFNWREMELNEYLYCNGEVVRLWGYPRGPDSGFLVYPGSGTRHTYFGTTGMSHALGQPCYVVRPLARGEEARPNGLPVFTVYYENDDDPKRRLGKDSKLAFVAPEDGRYRVRVSDVRGFGGADYGYELTVRVPEPHFSARVDGFKAMKLARGEAREFVVKLERFDDFEGAVRVEIDGLAPGLHVTSPLVVEAGQHMAMGVIWAGKNAPLAAGDSSAEKPTIVARAMVGGVELEREVAGFGNVEVLEATEDPFRVALYADGESGEPMVSEGGRLLELTVEPGETVTAIVRARRGEFEERIEFGKQDSGRNLAHGLIIDNIGLNGLMIPVGKTEQRFFITAADWVPESTRTFHLRTVQDPKVATQAIRLKVRRPDDQAN